MQLSQKMREHAYVIASGMLLSYNSGFVNGCCLSGALAEGAPKQSVAGFTGTYTNAGLEFASGNGGDGWFHVQMILSFLAGATLTGLMMPRAVAWEISHEYGPTFIVGASLLGVSSCLAEYCPTGKGYYYLAAAANGLQNGMSSTYSANLIRSTHLTGTTTDIGIILGQLLRGRRDNLWKLLVLVFLTLAFFLGSFSSYYAVQEWTHHTLFFNAALFLVIGVGCILWRFQPRSIPPRSPTRAVHSRTMPTPPRSPAPYGIGIVQSRAMPTPPRSPAPNMQSRAMATPPRSPIGFIQSRIMKSP